MFNINIFFESLPPLRRGKGRATDASVGLFLFLLSLTSFSQGVVFQQMPLKDAFKAAKNANLPLFVEVYSPTCHVCQSFIPVFNEASVGSFFNKNFVSIKVDVNSTEFKEYFDKKRHYFIPSLPMMLFFDGNENFLHHAQLGEGMPSSGVINFAKEVLNPNTQTRNWAEKFKNGNREMDFMIDYAMQCRFFKDTASNIQVGNELFKKFNKAELNGKISWLINEKLVSDVDNGFFQYWINNFNASKQFANGYEKMYMENIIMSSLHSSRGNKYDSKKINQLNGYLSKIGRSKAEINNLTTLSMTKALLKEGSTSKAANELNAILQTQNPGWGELVFWTSLFNDNAQDANYKNVAIEWLKKAISQTKSAKDASDIHYQSAKLYLKSGDKKEAKKALDMAIKNAKLAKIDLKKFEELSRNLN
jgi:thiol-disulfide isomerase/thioredoxin/tetratricopeptide (TPR) repeat protein